VKRHPSRQHLIQQYPKRINVGPGIGFQTAHLFRRHVLDGPYYVSLPGHSGGAQHPGNAKVHDLDRPRLRQHHVGGLDIPVNYAEAVRVVDSLQRLAEHRHGAFYRHPSRPSQHAVQRFAPDEFHHHEEVIALSEEAEQSGDVRMVELRKSNGLRAEPLHYIRLAGQFRAQRFDGHLSLQHQVHTFID